MVYRHGTIRNGSSECGPERVHVHVGHFPGLVGTGAFVVRIAVRVVDHIVLGGRRTRRERRHTPQCRKIFSITSACGGSMKAMTSIVAAAFWASQGIDFIHSLDEHRPGLTGRPGVRTTATAEQ